MKEAGMEKVNFSGGEPLLIDDGDYVGVLAEFCKTELSLCVSLVTNGSLVRESWFDRYGRFFDIIAVSCDSFDDATNKKIGRWDAKQGAHTNGVLDVAEWCKKYNVKFKINTVVNSANKDEDMTAAILKLQPVRWKIFQCLEVEGENKAKAGKKALRDAHSFLVADEEYRSFLDRHSSISDKIRIPEPNQIMQDSYIILDENMCFLDCRQGGKIPSVSLLTNPSAALKMFEQMFDRSSFMQRDGEYYKEINKQQGCAINKQLEW